MQPLLHMGRFKRPSARQAGLMAFLALVSGVVIPGLIASPAHAATAAVSITKIVDGYALLSIPATQPQPYSSKTVDVQYSGSGPVLLAASSDGAGFIHVLDTLQILVNGDQVYQGSFTSDNNNCNPVVTPIAPLDLSKFFKAGANKLTVNLINTCGYVGSSALYLVIGSEGSSAPYAAPLPTPTPSPELPPPPTPTPVPVGCPTLQFVGVRGSGEKATDAGGYGKTVAAVKDYLEQKVPSVASIPIDYEAVKVEYANFNYGSHYERSIATGHVALDKFLTDFITHCPKTYVVLAGYSQGAHVVGDEFAYLTSTEKLHIAAVVMIGDPRFNPKQPRVDDGDYDSKLKGAYQMIIPAMRVIDKAWVANVHSYCASGDPVCNYSKGNLDACISLVLFGRCVHQLYPDTDWPALAAFWAIKHWSKMPALK